MSGGDIQRIFHELNRQEISTSTRGTAQVLWDYLRSRWI